MIASWVPWPILAGGYRTRRWATSCVAKCEKNGILTVTYLILMTSWRREVNSNFMYCSEIDGKLLALRRVATGAAWLFKRQQPVGFTAVVGHRHGPGLEGAHRRGTDLLHPATGLRSQAKL